MTEERERLKVDSQPVKLRIESEPYAKFIGRKYAAVLNVYDLKRKRDYYLIIEAQSLSQPLNDIVEVEGGLVGMEVWINKASDEKMAKYQLTIA